MIPITSSARSIFDRRPLTAAILSGMLTAGAPFTATVVVPRPRAARAPSRGVLAGALQPLASAVNAFGGDQQRYVLFT